MNTFSRSPLPTPPFPAPASGAHRPLGRAGRQLLATHLAAAASTGAFVLLLGRRLAHTVAGPLTLGMVILSLQVLTVLIAALRFERHCAAPTDGQSAQHLQSGRQL
ncbi:hypothetical protein AB0945_38230 [Streptomyces sp. NPDC005474]|uniref:hypothetical protein n=1 Tax=Streptomyces sp. NPDC005474 TaxID=3154878 RepID=UPI0034526F84